MAADMRGVYRPETDTVVVESKSSDYRVEPRNK
jgi:hypothetical protein